MKLYMHPVSTACRPVRLLIAEKSVNCEEETVDILKGAHYQEPYTLA
jgi:glutathione S-transferase